MNKSETLQILGRVKAAWPRQPVDEEVISVWHQTLAGVPLEIAELALVEIVQTDRKEPPTPGLLYENSMRVFSRKQDEQRAAIRALPEPERSPAEIDSVRVLLDDYFAKHPGPEADARSARHKGRD